MKAFKLTFALLLISTCMSAQQLPQQSINEALAKGYELAAAGTNAIRSTGATGTSSGVYSLMKSWPVTESRIKEFASSAILRTSMIDTIVVGDTPNDTLLISGTFFNNGPIIVLNDGVVIFQNANATILGDMIVVQDGQVWATGSTLFFPQLYFYHRSWIIVNNAYVNITNCTLDFSGLSHSLAVSDDADIEMQNVINNGFTTAGAYLNATISIDSTNQAGEFIMTNNATLNFNDANTVLLWYHVGDNAVVSTTFPSGLSVSSYSFNSTVPGVTGIDYDVTVTNCTDVMWALMPENGSDVTITGSSIRAIGAWFARGDTVTVSGLVNNSTYSNFTAPLSDRNLQLNNCTVQTWSLYIFDSSQINVTGCIIGELGTMGTSRCNTQNVFCDGSGGYFWAAEQSFCVGIGSSVSSYVRSEKNGIMLFGYGSVIGGASALNNSVLITVQSNLPADPIPYDNAIAWMIRVDQPTAAFADSIVSIPGSAWIDQGPLASWMDMDRYRLWYSPGALNPPQWVAITPEIFAEVRNDELGLWDTHGIAPGTYNVRLSTFNNANDSIDAVKQVTLLPSILGIESSEVNNYTYIYPVPASDKITLVSTLFKMGTCEVSLYDATGKLLSSHAVKFNQEGFYEVLTSGWKQGIYFVEIVSGDKREKLQFIISD